MRETYQKTPVRQGKLLFNFEGTERKLHKGIRKQVPVKWGCSSAGRAPALHAGGQEFDPPHLHQGTRKKNCEGS